VIFLVESGVMWIVVKVSAQEVLGRDAITT
jgi:hypothetical protein